MSMQDLSCDPGGDHVAVPVGLPQFVADFLESCMSKVQTFCDQVRAIAAEAPPGEPGVQAANLLVRHCSAQKASHLIRLLPPERTEAMTTAIDSIVLQTFKDINGLDADGVNGLAEQIRLPLRHGGMGLRSLEPLRHSAYVACWAQCAHFVAVQLSPVLPEMNDWRAARAPVQQCVRAATGHPQALAIDAMAVVEANWTDFRSLERPKLQRPLTVAFWDKRARSWAAGTRTRAAQTALSSSGVGAGNWLIATPSSDDTCLPDEVYQFAVRLRLGLPLAEVGAPCCVFNRTSRRVCGRSLTAMADHAVGCAKSERNARHNWLRDWWMQVISEAGGRARHEQVVTEYLPHKYTCADVLASYGPAAPRTYYDMVVAHPFTTGVPTGAANGKLNVDYAPPVDPATRVPRVKIAPLAFDTHGRWEHAPVNELNCGLDGDSSRRTQGEVSGSAASTRPS